MMNLEEVESLRQKLLSENVPKPEIVRQLAESCMGWPYVFGALGEECTPSLRKRRARNAHPTIVSKCQVLNGKAKTCDGCKWKGARMYDCRGFTYWLLKMVGIAISTVGASTQYNRTADWVARGEIKDMPNLVCCVFQRQGNKMAHTGMHVGNGKIIHCSVNVQSGKISDRGWTHYAIPVGLYTDEEIKNAGGVVIVANLKRGSKGEAVTKLQTSLNLLGYDCGTADGIFGAKTAAAVKRFQADNGLTVDGIAGEKTQSVLTAKLANARQTDGNGSLSPSQGKDEEILIQKVKAVRGALEALKISVTDETAYQVYLALKPIYEKE